MCNDSAGVRAHFAQKYAAAIPATATLPAVPAETYWYSKELVAYIMAILSTVAYHRVATPASPASWMRHTPRPSVSFAG